jgi:hypothetical protein
VSCKEDTSDTYGTKEEDESWPTIKKIIKRVKVSVVGYVRRIDLFLSATPRAERHQELRLPLPQPHA